MTRPVADAVWLAVCHVSAGIQLRGRERRVDDRAAARRAWAIALGLTGLCHMKAVGSRAHTEGSGAALVGPKGTVLGVDLVWPRRITPRHARAILDPEEWEVLPPPLDIRAALGWGLKEAAAKAMGAPVRRFPAGLRIGRAANRLEVIDRDEPRSIVVGHWEVVGCLLCVWVLGRQWPRAAAGERCRPGGGAVAALSGGRLEEWREAATNQWLTENVTGGGYGQSPTDRGELSARSEVLSAQL